VIRLQGEVDISEEMLVMSQRIKDGEPLFFYHTPTELCPVKGYTLEPYWLFFSINYLVEVGADTIVRDISHHPQW
jgi:hypothetical protein